MNVVIEAIRIGLFLQFPWIICNHKWCCRWVIIDEGTQGPLVVPSWSTLKVLLNVWLSGLWLIPSGSPNCLSVRWPWLLLVNIGTFIQWHKLKYSWNTKTAIAAANMPALNDKMVIKAAIVFELMTKTARLLKKDALDRNIDFVVMILWSGQGLR